MHVLLVNTPYSHMQNFGPTGVSSGLATRMELPRVSQRRSEEAITDVSVCTPCVSRCGTAPHACSASLEGRI
jgi:hypothetical protein